MLYEGGPEVRPDAEDCWPADDIVYDELALRGEVEVDPPALEEVDPPTDMAWADVGRSVEAGACDVTVL